MSYCRWSDCDVYVYAASTGGWTTHVAGRRNAAGKAPPLDWTSTETLMASYRATIQWDKDNPHMVDINLPSAGMTFTDNTPGQCADRLEALRAEGFDVPQYAIDALREEEGEE